VCFVLVNTHPAETGVVGRTTTKTLSESLDDAVTTGNDAVLGAGAQA
jgi:hypothetical protein